MTSNPLCASEMQLYNVITVSLPLYQRFCLKVSWYRFRSAVELFAYLGQYLHYWCTIWFLIVRYESLRYRPCRTRHLVDEGELILRNRAVSNFDYSTDIVCRLCEIKMRYEMELNMERRIRLSLLVTKDAV